MLTLRLITDKLFRLYARSAPDGGPQVGPVQVPRTVNVEEVSTPNETVLITVTETFIYENVVSRSIIQETIGEPL